MVMDMGPVVIPAILAVTPDIPPTATPETPVVGVDWDGDDTGAGIIRPSAVITASAVVPRTDLAVLLMPTVDVAFDAAAAIGLRVPAVRQWPTSLSHQPAVVPCQPAAVRFPAASSSVRPS